MDTEDTREESCLSRRCGLCQFSLVAGDDIVAVRQGIPSSPFQYNLYVEICHGKSVVIYEICRGACSHSDGWAPGCHVECLRLIGERVQESLDVMKYSFKPTSSTQQLRYSWLLNDVVSMGVKDKTDVADETRKLLRGLAPELRYWIAEQLLREYATARLSILRPSDHNHLHNFSTSTAVWARPVRFEGMTYIASLSNERVDGQTQQLIYAPAAQRDIDTVYLCEDHLGILQVIFGNSRQTPKITQRLDVWWRSLQLPSDCLLQGKTDGIKLRTLRCMESMNSTTPRCVMWATPRSPTEQLRTHRFRRAPAPAEPLQMVSFQCNHPPITAYSVCWNARILAIQAHEPEQDLTFYKSATFSQGPVLWLYMPIEHDDTISETWKRSGRLDRQNALLFKTTRGRLCLFGPWPRVGWDTCTWTLLDRPNARPVEISYDRSESGIHELAFETPQPVKEGIHPELSWPSSPYPESSSLRDYFYSSAILDNIVEVIQCQQPSGMEGISGLVFRSADGCEACVGEIRLDCLGHPVPISRPADMWLGFAIASRGVFVQRVEFFQPPDGSTITWFKVPFRGRLEWWSSLDQCKVYHEGRASPITKL